MSNDEKFEYDIANLKKDLAIEDMIITENDVALLKKYYKKEITMNEMINVIIKESSI